jgi:hypothetical protein
MTSTPHSQTTALNRESRPRQRDDVTQDDLGAAVGDPPAQAVPGHPHLHLGQVDAGDLVDMSGVTSQQPARPAPDLQQVVIGRGDNT